MPMARNKLSRTLAIVAFPLISCATVFSLVVFSLSGDSTIPINRGGVVMNGSFVNLYLLFLNEQQSNFISFK